MLTFCEQVIKEPMDLGTIKARLESSYYASAGDYVADVRLAFRYVMTTAGVLFMRLWWSTLWPLQVSYPWDCGGVHYDHYRFLIHETVVEYIMTTTGVLFMRLWSSILWTPHKNIRFLIWEKYVFSIIIYEVFAKYSAIITHASASGTLWPLFKCY